MGLFSFKRAHRDISPVTVDAVRRLAAGEGVTDSDPLFVHPGFEEAIGLGLIEDRSPGWGAARYFVTKAGREAMAEGDSSTHLAEITPKPTFQNPTS